jgi:uncharacterized heparinase superfamily protein
VTQLALYLHTLRHLRPVQLRQQLLKRLWPVSLPRPIQRDPAVRAGLAPLTCLPPQSGLVSADGSFTFLNARGSASANGVDWAARGMSRLWRYNLHYFDYLLDESLAASSRAELIDDWVSRNPPGTADAWDAYPLSLRIVNWVKHFLACGRTVPPHWRVSLFSQAAWLERNFEYHLLGNHLLKNAVALVFAGCYFEGVEASRWLQRGWDCFTEQVLEQFLSDGGHYERSPMYHALCLADCLDVLSLTAQSPIAARVRPEAMVHARIRSAALFLRDICCPDGEIPLFNDAAFGIAPTPRELLAYAQRVLPADLRPCFPQPQHCELIDKQPSGYFGFRHGTDWLLVDCGPVGPDYQPGHAHCDTLSYELSLDGARVIVDTGVYDYEAGARRLASRSTSGHNTVVIDGCEQSEIWGAFRVARRARPVSAVLKTSGTGCTFEGTHDGYRRLPGKPIHRRRISYDGAGIVEVADEVFGGGTHVAASRIRLHPGYTPVTYGSYAVVLGPDGKPAARLEFSDGTTPRLEEGWYFPQFGSALACAVLVLETRGRLPLRISYRIVKAARS